MSRPDFLPHPIDWDEERVARFWDFMASRTSPEGYFSSRMAPEVARLMERHIAPLGRILDVGCGTGDLLVELQGRGHEVVGADTSPESVAAARVRLGDVDGDRVRVATPGSLPFGDGSVDTLVLAEVIEHLSDQALAGALREAHRVLRRGGHMVVTTPNGEDLARELVQCPDCGAEFHRMQHVRSWTPETLEAALAAAGFGSARILALRLPERSGTVQRLARIAWYRLRRDRRNLVGFVTRR